MQSFSFIEPETHRRTDVFSKIRARANKQYPYTFLGGFCGRSNCAQGASHNNQIDLTHNRNLPRALMHRLGTEGRIHEQS
jgi:hypothetical protein